MAPNSTSCYLQSFQLYETFSSYYLIGRDKRRTLWRVLKIDRLECSELNIAEDSTAYSEHECSDLLKRLDEGNKKTGGLKLVTTCYGIIGFVKFLEPYYMLLITKRKKIGEICGHKIYAIAKSKMITISNPTVRTLMAYSKNENRYKKLLCTVDLTKDFFFSYSYHVMRSLQKNLCKYKEGQFLYDTKFVWNEFLTSEIRKNLNNTLWTVALVHGFFKQDKHSIDGRDFKWTLIARRSRLYAGTRYLKRGLNERGRVANDVETEQIVEQIVSEDAAEGCPMQISSVVQYRGSVPLFWSQKTTGLRKFRPEFSLPQEQHDYKATKLHFKNLVNRYGKPIVILSLLKTRGKKRAEKALGAAYAKAIISIIDNCPQDDYLRFCRWDLHRHMYYRSAVIEVQQLGELAADTLDLTGIYHCQVTGNLWQEGCLNLSYFEKYNVNNLGKKVSDGCDSNDANGNDDVKTMMFQKGVLRTNCMDCLDRTNVAQYVYGLVALGRQLHALGFMESPNINLENPLAGGLMRVYEAMGDTLALQYGGSPAHSKIFAELRGKWKLATDYQDILIALKRFYSNAFSDPNRQDAINLFLGYFRPQNGKPALWELDSDQRYNFGRSSSQKRSLSDSDVLSISDSIMASTDVGHNQPFSEEIKGGTMSLLEIMSEIPTDKAQGGRTSLLNFTPEISTSIRLHPDQSFKSDHIYNDEHGEASNHSNLFDMDWNSSAGNSYHEASESRCLLCQNFDYGMEKIMLDGYSKSFVHWVFHGEALSFSEVN